MDHETEDNTQRALGRLEGKMDQALGFLSTIKDHEKRIVKVEKWQSRVVGWGLGISGTVSVGYAIFTALK